MRKSTFEPGRRWQLQCGTIVALVLALSGIAWAADQGATDAVAASALKTDTSYKIGDRYGYRTMDGFSLVEEARYLLRVTGVAENRVMFNDGFYVSDRLGNDIAIGSYNRMSAQEVFVPEYSVGKKWSTLYHLSKAEGAEFDVTYHFEVVGREKITVPAGTFDAYRIEGGGYMHQLRGHRAGPCKEKNSIFTFWVAPAEVRRFIAMHYIQRGAAIGCKYSVVSRTELVYYQQDGRAAGVESPVVENFIPGDATLPEYSIFGPL